MNPSHIIEKTDALEPNRWAFDLGIYEANLTTTPPADKTMPSKIFSSIELQLRMKPEFAHWFATLKPAEKQRWSSVLEAGMTHMSQYMEALRQKNHYPEYKALSLTTGRKWVENGAKAVESGDFREKDLRILVSDQYGDKTKYSHVPHDWPSTLNVDKAICRKLENMQSKAMEILPEAFTPYRKAIQNADSDQAFSRYSEVSAQWQRACIAFQNIGTSHSRTPS